MFITKKVKYCNFGQVKIFIHNYSEKSAAIFGLMLGRSWATFSVVGPSAWNDLPFDLRSLLMAHPSKFYISL